MATTKKCAVFACAELDEWENETNKKLDERTNEEGNKRTNEWYGRLQKQNENGFEREKKNF